MNNENKNFDASKISDFLGKIWNVDNVKFLTKLNRILLIIDVLACAVCGLIELFGGFILFAIFAEPPVCFLLWIVAAFIIYVIYAINAVVLNFFKHFSDEDKEKNALAANNELPEI